MKVVGAGFGRTGTLTLKRALEILGQGPCYHMEELIKHPGHAGTWEAASRGEPVDWKQFFEGWGSSVDWPACSYYQQILAAHPEARVILSVRNPERWYQSCRETIYLPSSLFPMRVVLPWIPGMRRIFTMAKRLVWETTFEGRFEDKAFALQRFQTHIDQVKASVPPDKLLVFEAAQGWEPLCRFLNLPVPQEPFPHVNDAASMRLQMKVVNAVCWILLFLPVLLILGLASLLLG